MRGYPNPAMKSPGKAVIGASWYIAGMNSGGKVINIPRHIHRAPIAITVKALNIFFWRRMPVMRLPVAIPAEARIRTVPPYVIDLWNSSFRNGVSATYSNMIS